MPEASNTTARMLAPIALAVFAIAFFAVVLSSGESDDEKDDTDERPAAGTRKSESRRGGEEPTPRTSAASYTVKTGDTLAGISEKTGLSVEKLQELNPELDPQALVSGQKIRLRE
jgi:LysM repeat protein